MVADGSGITLMGGTGNDYVLADVAVVADDHTCFLAFIVQVLRDGTYHSVVIDHRALTYLGSLQDVGVCLDGTAVAYLHIAFDKCEGLYGHVLADLSGWIYVC